IDFGQELLDNENEFFQNDNLRFFDLFTSKVSRLQGMISTLRDYTTQVRELYQSELSVKQNRIMTVLTVVTTIIMPLTLVTGWYGMNFKYMPELEAPLAYPVVIGVMLVMAIGGIIYFKKKKWL
ncbi:LPXTG cell wall anchor domain protein, partial [Fusobacterium sp. CM21]